MAILVEMHLTVMQRRFYYIPEEHNIVEILPPRKGQNIAFIQNVYSPPRDRVTNFAPLFADTSKLAKHNRILGLLKKYPTFFF